jgi:hypothetical protein
MNLTPTRRKVLRDYESIELGLKFLLDNDQIEPADRDNILEHLREWMKRKGIKWKTENEK